MSKLISFYRLLKFIWSYLTVSPEGHITIKAPGFSLTTNNKGFLLDVDGDLRLYYRYYLANCDPDFDPEAYYQEISREVPQDHDDKPKCAPCRALAQPSSE